MHKVAAYADDLMFMATNPRVLLPSLLTELGNYSIISNHKIYLDKSEAMNISVLEATLQFCQGILCSDGRKGN